MTNDAGDGKLVRDRIPEIIERTGRTPDTHVLDDASYAVALHAKLDEESAEVHGASSEELAEELADVLEVLHALADLQGIAWSEVERVRMIKADERGGFGGRIWLTSTP